MKMNRRQFSTFAISLSVAVDPVAASDHAGPFDPPVVRVNDHDLEVVTPGRYKLVKDIVVPRNPLAAIFGESGKGGCLVSLLTGEVELDLDGHEIDIRHDKAAISLSQGSNRELFPLRHLDPRGADGRHVTIRNGTVNLSDDDRGNDGIGLINKWTQPGRMRGALGIDTPSGLESPKGVVYARTEYHLEKLKVLSRGVSVAVEGEWNVIRDCVIESSGNAAIFSAGPNVLIENCEIRLAGPG